MARGTVARYLQYRLNPSEEYIELKPIGCLCPTPYETRISLPLTAATRCRLEFSGRCLLAADAALYGDGYVRRASGRVALTAVIGRDGRLDRIQVVDAVSTPPETQSLFTVAAVANCRTWQLEPASQKDTLRVTYAYVIDDSLPQGALNVQFASPDGVTIRANPPKPPQ